MNSPTFRARVLAIIHGRGKGWSRKRAAAGYAKGISPEGLDGIIDRYAEGRTRGHTEILLANALAIPIEELRALRDER